MDDMRKQMVFYQVSSSSYFYFSGLAWTNIGRRNSLLLSTLSLTPTPTYHTHNRQGSAATLTQGFAAALWVKSPR